MNVLKCLLGGYSICCGLFGAYGMGGLFLATHYQDEERRKKYKQKPFTKSELMAVYAFLPFAAGFGFCIGSTVGAIAFPIQYYRDRNEQKLKYNSLNY